MAEGPCNALVCIEKSLQSMNDLDILPRSQLLLLNGCTAYHFLLVDCCLNIFIYDRFQDTNTTFEVNVTACDLENSFIFDNKA